MWESNAPVHYSGFVSVQVKISMSSLKIRFESLPVRMNNLNQMCIYSKMDKSTDQTGSYNPLEKLFKEHSYPWWVGSLFAYFRYRVFKKKRNSLKCRYFCFKNLQNDKVHQIKNMYENIYIIGYYPGFYSSLKDQNCANGGHFEFFVIWKWIRNIHAKYQLSLFNLGHQFKMTTICSIFIHQGAAKAWIIANCIYFNI